MSSNSGREDAAKLEVELAKLEAQVDGMSLSERKLRVTALRDGLENMGVALTVDDEEIISCFTECRCTCKDLVKHFYGRFFQK